MIATSNTTGQTIDGIKVIRQSVADILTTLVGTRVERRDYGSVLPLLIDQPENGATLLRAYMAAVVALQRWEPRIHITRIQRSADAAYPGSARFSIDAITASGEQATLNVNAGAA